MYANTQGAAAAAFAILHLVLKACPRLQPCSIWCICLIRLHQPIRAFELQSHNLSALLAELALVELDDSMSCSDLQSYPSLADLS